MSENGKTKFIGVLVKPEILGDRRLTIAEKFIFSYVASYKKVCWDSNACIADRLGLSVPTVTRAIKRLQEAGFLFVDYQKGNNSKRKIFVVWNQPNKRRILERKNRGESATFPQSFPQSFPHSNQNDYPPNQNDSKSNQNDEPRNRGESNQNDYHRIIRGKRGSKKTTIRPCSKQDLAGLAGSRPASQVIRAKDFENVQDFEKAFYARNTFRLGAS